MELDSETEKEFRTRFKNLSGGYDLEYASDGRLINAVLNPYGAYLGITPDERKFYTEIIKSRAKTNLDIGYNFTTILLSQKLGFSLPNRSSGNFIHMTRYSQILEDLIDLREKLDEEEQELLDEVTWTNIYAYINNSNENTIFQETKDEEVDVSSISFDPKETNGVVKISVKNRKTPQSYVEKTIERFYRIHSNFGERKYPAMENHMEILKSGHEVIKTNFLDVVHSGQDLYEYINNNNPKFLPPEEIGDFKDRLTALFPIDYTGVKIVMESRDHVRKLVGNLIKNKEKRLYGLPILVSHYEDNISLEEKDCSVTLGVGDNNSFHAVSEIKIISLRDELNAEWGARNHCSYKGEKKALLEEILNGEKANYYAPMYENGALAFGFTPKLVNTLYGKQ